MLSLVTFLAVGIFAVCECLALSAPPSGAITIGSGGTYSTISSALADTSSSTYFIYAGTYNEQVYITRANIKIYGQTSSPLTYSGNKVTITAAVPANTAGSDDASGTVRVHADGVSLYNLIIQNTYGHPVVQSQAIALSLYGTTFGGYGLKITGYQDTLYSNQGTHYIAYSWIEGAVDFIFGREASLWVTKSTINTVGSGCITASGRETDDSLYYVIDHTTVTGTSGTSSAYLGRPWGDYARVIFQNSNLGSVINPAGWSVWSTSDPNTEYVTFAEYNNTGTGASGTRASFSEKLSSPISITTVLGSTSWIDTSYL